MSFGEKVRVVIISKAAEGLAVSASIVLIWIASKIAPVVLPALESNLSKSLLLSLLLASMALNVIFAVLFWIMYRKPEFRLKYGIYWDSDKNPHCPSCKIPIAGYGTYQFGKTGYYCKPCKKVFPLQDSAGNDIKPDQAIREL